MDILTRDYEFFGSKERAEEFVSNHSSELGSDYEKGYVTFNIIPMKDNFKLEMIVYNESSVTAFFTGNPENPDIAVYERD